MKIRINDLARELEVKSKAILDALPEVGVTEKKSHSSSLEDHEAEKVRAKFRAASEAQTASRASRFSRAEADAIKTKIDLSHISKPGDVLKAIISKQQPAAPTAAPARPSAAPPPVDAKSAAIPYSSLTSPQAMRSCMCGRHNRHARCCSNSTRCYGNSISTREETWALSCSAITATHRWQTTPSRSRRF